jgi:hypothetical protein
MPKGRFAKIVVLAEDETQFWFFRRWLLGWVKHLSASDIHEVLAPTGQGSGEQFVRTQFPIEAEAHRRHSRSRGAMLIAVIDADTGSVANHYQQLRLQAPAKDGVFVFVPKRNIETWLHQLNGNAANEQDDYKPMYTRDPAPAIIVAAKEFLEYTNSPAKPTDTLVPSLAFGIKTAREVPKSHEPLQR